MSINSRNSSNAHEKDGFNGLSIAAEFLYLCRMLFHPRGNSRIGPAKDLTCFQRHKSMSNIAQNMRGCVTDYVVTFDPFKQLLAMRTELWFRSKGIDENVRVNEDRSAICNLRENHGDS